MAVLNKIRQRSVFLIAIIALALFAFVLSDVITKGGMNSTKSQNVIGTVNDEDIDREDFARQVEAYQQSMGPSATTSQVVNQVWDAKLREVVLKEEFEKLGIGVGEAQVKDILRQRLAGNPTFSNEAGMFDEYKLQEYVANLKATSPQAYDQWVQFENAAAESARETIYYDLIRAGIGATLMEGEQAYKLANDNVDLKYVQLPYTSIDDSEVSISKDEINSYVKDHSDRFKVEKSRDIQYVFFQETASADDEAEAKEAINSVLTGKTEFNSVTNSTDTISSFNDTEDNMAYVNANSDIQFVDRYMFKSEMRGDNIEKLYNMQPGEVFGPYKEGGFWKVSKMIDAKQMADSAKASHIMISWQGLQTAGETTRTKEEAKALADSIASVVKSDKSKFSTLATEFSQDQSSAVQGGDLGFFVPGMMVGPFNDFVFENNKGDVGVVETDFGFHVISIEDKTDEERAVKIATIARDIQPSEKSMNDLYAKVTKFEIAAKDNGFNEEVKKEGYEIRTVRDMKVMDENITGVGPQRKVIQWAFEDGVEAGDIKRFDIPSGYIVAQVTAVKKAGTMTAEDASSTVSPILMKDKKAKLLKEKIKGSSLEAIAQNQGAVVQTASAVNLQTPTLAGAGNEPEVVGAVFSMKPGEVSKPIQGNYGVYVVSLTAKNNAPKMDDYRGFATQETAKRRQTVTTNVFEALKNNAEIEDNRAKFY